ncbi:MAG: heavy-metal-associated domain-containing protein [Sphingobacteriaceae bacterium]|nr:heavy-metal-associated domain-containing protein [Sphingobacteriaceae bacterium]
MLRLLILLLLISCSTLKSQFVSGNVRVDGLTCSMCSKTVHKALFELAFIDSLTPDLQTASFKIVFKKGVPVDPEAMLGKITGAGFSIGELKLDFKFSNFDAQSSVVLFKDNMQYHFFGIKEGTLDGEKSFKIMNKRFVSKKQYKAYSKDPKYKAGLVFDKDMCGTANLNYFAVTF